jgi:hypothetical protein
MNDYLVAIDYALKQAGFYELKSHHANDVLGAILTIIRELHESGWEVSNFKEIEPF